MIIKPVYTFLKIIFFTVYLGITLPIDAGEKSSQINSLSVKKSIQLTQAYKGQSIIVFGTTNCPATQLLIKELKSRKIAYIFKDANLQTNKEESFQLAFENNMTLDSYRVPAVGVNNKLLATKKGVDIQQVLAELSQTSNSVVDSTKRIYSTPVVIYDVNNKLELTVRIIKGLQNKKIPYEFKNIENPSVKKEMWIALEKSNYTSSSVSPPVISINGKAFVFSDFPQILTELSRNQKE